MRNHTYTGSAQPPRAALSLPFHQASPLAAPAAVADGARHIFFCCSTTARSGRPVIGSRYLAHTPYNLRALVAPVSHVPRKPSCHRPSRPALDQISLLPASPVGQVHDGLVFRCSVDPAQAHRLVGAPEHLHIPHHRAVRQHGMDALHCLRGRATRAGLSSCVRPAAALALVNAVAAGSHLPAQS